MKKIAVISLVIGVCLLIYYIIQLFCIGYINPKTEFSVDRAKDISSFMGSFIGIFFTLAGTFLILENLRSQNLINSTNQILTQKNQFESIYFNLLSLHNKIVNEIQTSIETPYNNKINDNVKGRFFFELLSPSIAYDFKNSEEKTTLTVRKIYRKYYAVHASDIGHYFRNLFHIVNFVDTNHYFTLIEKKEGFLQKSDYIKILRAQLTNTEIACLAVNGLSDKGEAFKPLIEKYELLWNLHFDFELPTEKYWDVVPCPEVLVEEYPHLVKVFEYQKKTTANSVQNSLLILG
jgi:hypothetical protein